MHGIRQHFNKKLKKGFTVVNKKVLKSGKLQVTLRGPAKLHKSVGKKQQVTYNLVLPKAVRKK